MSDEFCAGVKILLKRIESNPDEFRGEYGRWADIRNGVFAYKEQGERNAWVRGLTKEEIDALYEKLSAIHRAVLDEYVMKNMLDEPEEKHWAVDAMAQARGKEIIGSWNDPRMLAQSSVFTVTAGGGGGSGQVQIKPESVMSKLKRELGL